MTENTLNVENVVENSGEVKVDEPKTYTQEEVDNIVKSRLARADKKHQSKIEELKADNEEMERELKDARTLSGVLAEGGMIKGNFAEQAKQLSDTYDVNEDNFTRIKNEASLDSKSQQKNLAYINAQRIIAESDITELEAEFERIGAKPYSERSIEEREMYKQLKPKVDEFKAKQKEVQKNNFDTDKAWLENEVEGADFDKLIRSNEFADFINTTGMEVRKGLQAFVKLNKTTIAEKFVKEKASRVSTGSVKDSGTSKLKEFYSPEDVDNLSEKDYDDPEIRKRVRESMTKW